jgi:hypothetical protein
MCDLSNVSVTAMFLWTHAICERCLLYSEDVT